MIEQLERLYELAVWSTDGRQWLPLFGYDDEVVAYAPAQEAITTFWAIRGHQVTK